MQEEKCGGAGSKSLFFKRLVHLTGPAFVLFATRIFIWQILFTPNIFEPALNTILKFQKYPLYRK